MYDNDDDIQVRTMDQRQKLLTGLDKMESSTQTLQNVQRLANETGEMQISTATELDSQKESLLRANRQLDTVDDNLRRARRIMIVMTTRAITNKIVLYIVIILLLAALGGAIYWKVKKFIGS